MIDQQQENLKDRITILMNQNNSLLNMINQYDTYFF